MTKQAFQKEVQKIVNQIIEGYNPEKIILFGSAASGKTREDSDIDMLIVKNTTKRFVDRIGEVLNICDYEVPIEPFIYTPKEIKDRISIKDNFIKEILENGKTLYIKKS